MRRGAALVTGSAKRYVAKANARGIERVLV